MATVYGESVVYTRESYEESGGIALLAAPPAEGAITSSGGGSGEEVVTPNTVRWWVAKDETEKYIGGITGEGWYIEAQPIGETGLYAYGPFYGLGMTEEQIYDYAYNHGNLDTYFSAWNANHADDNVISNFIFFLTNYSDDHSCGSGGGASGGN